MKQSGQGKGKLVPTGKLGPALDVSYDISQEGAETKAASGETVKWKRAIVHRIACDDGQPIAFGDFDLMVGNEMLRLKHIANDPEWLVLSSDA